MNSNFINSALTSPSEMKTYYASMLDRLVGGYTVEWKNNDKIHKVKSYLRFKDFQGFVPPIQSFFNLPKSIITSFQAKRHPILPKPIPFLVFESIEFLESVIKPGMKVLEVGGGNSSLWFLKQGCSLTTIEHNQEWADFIKKFIDEHKNDFDGAARANFDIKVCEGREAIQFIQGKPDASFDLVLVDCMNAFTNRNTSLIESLGKVKKGGWVVLDNADHPQNWKSLDFMKGFKRIRFTGFAPMGMIVTQTSIWQKT